MAGEPEDHGGEVGGTPGFEPGGIGPEPYPSLGTISESRDSGGHDTSRRLARWVRARRPALGRGALAAGMCVNRRWEIVVMGDSSWEIQGDSSWEIQGSSLLKLWGVMCKPRSS